MTNHSVFMKFWKSFLKYKILVFNGEQEKNLLTVRGWDRKICLASRVMTTVIARTDFSGWIFFLSRSHTHDPILYIRVFFELSKQLSGSL